MAALLAFPSLAAAVAYGGERALGGVARGARRAPIVAMAQDKRRRTANVEGNLFVDESCIDCDTCRWMAPHTFSRDDSKSYVHTQPEQDGARRDALAAAIACPTGSIRLEQPDPLVKQVKDDFPLRIDATCPNVYHLGFHSAASFGAVPYLLDSPEGICMVDSPRYNSALARTIEKLHGAPRFMLLTHTDDVSDHGKWKERFPDMIRVMHKEDVRGPDRWPYIEMRDIEMQLEGEGPWELASGLTAIHTPGHSRGHLCFLATDHLTGGSGVLFTGDHLAFSGRLNRLDGFARYGWDVATQADSMRKLASLPFAWILPGHGRRLHFESEKERSDSILHAAAEFVEAPYGR